MYSFSCKLYQAPPTPRFWRVSLETRLIDQGQNINPLGTGASEGSKATSPTAEVLPSNNLDLLRFNELVIVNIAEHAVSHCNSDVWKDPGMLVEDHI